MVVGKVNQERYPTIPLILVSDDGEQFEVTAIIDTGCTTSLLLPSSLIEEMNLVFFSKTVSKLANDRAIQHKVYECNLIWNGLKMKALACEVGRKVIIGMQLLQGCELKIDCRLGGLVEIRPGSDW